MSRIDRLKIYVVAHAGATVACSAALTSVALIADATAGSPCLVSCEGGAATHIVHRIAGALLMTFLGIVAAFPLLIPVTAVAYPLVTFGSRFLRGRRAAAAAGGLAGLVIGLPLGLLVLSWSDWKGWSDWSQSIGPALPTLGFPAVSAGAAFAWIVASAARATMNPPPG